MKTILLAIAILISLGTVSNAQEYYYDHWSGYGPYGPRSHYFSSRGYFPGYRSYRPYYVPRMYGGFGPYNFRYGW